MLFWALALLSSRGITVLSDESTAFTPVEYLINGAACALTELVTVDELLA